MRALVIEFATLLVLLAGALACVVKLLVSDWLAPDEDSEDVQPSERSSYFTARRDRGAHR